MGEEKRVCSICGIEKDVGEFSKSYKFRCKKCVAKAAKERRNKEKRMADERDMLIYKLDMAKEIAKSLIDKDSLSNMSGEVLANEASRIVKTIYNNLSNE